MNKYIKIAYESRGLDPDFDRHILCEACEKVDAVDIDHIYGRGGKRNINNRKYDAHNLIFVCRKCHANKTLEDKKRRTKIVKSKIDLKKI